MGRTFRIKMHIRRFSRRHPWLILTVRSLMIFSAIHALPGSRPSGGTGHKTANSTAKKMST